jgi:hypothetical protein
MSCGGDSGGPYFVGDFDTAVQIGVVSFGPFNQSCNTNQALYNRDIASRVSYFYNFIKTIATDLPPQCGPLYLGPAVDTCDCGNQRPGEYARCLCMLRCQPLFVVFIFAHLVNTKACLGVSAITMWPQSQSIETNIRPHSAHAPCLCWPAGRAR